ncbi:hypothetical protein CYLTODRAFT_495068 [Cylindrobasidium torrendii FP15055 ss-10]|uniref:Plasma membrane fusion protein PRM1 n=1 Tax=Cylindrobasidium torrendii FP15055 ss-10 TaxID=1314674 RepID=A0A0D7AUV7_9AGAR|nr:hypothetical protein CYLTODRAFT_495068 [Cylindrobasidium torrendii FP15055 ss-10]
MSFPPPPTYDAPYDTHTGLRPYLTLPYLYSLSWLAYPIISLIFVAFRLQSSLDSTNNAIDSAKANLISACKAAEEAATSTASMPRYLALAMNEQYSDAVNASLNAARATLVVSLTIMEAIINFIIDIYRSTLLCFVELVIRGGLAIMIGAVDELNKAVTTVASGIQDGIQSSISSANSVIQGAVDAINKVNPFDDVSAPTIDTPDLSGLNNVTLPDSFSQGIRDLNSSLPTFDDIKEKIKAVIDTPFELLKKEINETFAGMSMSPKGMPVPELSRVQFCQDMDTSVVDDLGHDLVKITKIAIILIVVVALILIGLNCLLEWYMWRSQERHFEYIRQAWATDPSVHHVQGESAHQVSLTNHNLLMLHNTSEHPLITRICNVMSARLHLSSAQHNNMQWFFSYIFYPPALACLLIGLFGLLAIELQLLAMQPLVDHYKEQAASTASGFSNTIALSLNANMQNQSAAYASSVNAQVDSMQTQINEGMFGWVENTTSTLNETIVEFYDAVQDGVSAVFEGTILEDAAQEFIHCLIGTKVEAIENALTFLHDNLQVDLPRMNNSALVLSQSQVDEASAPIAAAAIGSGDDDDGGVVGKLVNSYSNSLKKERITFGIFLGLWAFVVLMGICILLWHSRRESRERRRYNEQRGGPTGFVDPYVVGQPMYPPQMDTEKSAASPRRPFALFNFKRRAQAQAEPAIKPAHSWDSFFNEKTTGAPPMRERTISEPRKLLALNRKGKSEQLVPDRSEPDLYGDDAPAPLYSAPEKHEDTGNGSTWFGRLFSRKQEQPTAVRAISPPSSRSGSPRPKPNLRISVERAAAMPSPEVVAENPEDTSNHSRWSSSPVQPPIAPWARVLSPPFRWSKSSKPQPSSDVPQDVNSTSYEEPSAIPSLAPPLHHGFTGPADSGVAGFGRPRELQPMVAKPHGGSLKWLKMDPYAAGTPTQQPPTNPFATPFDDDAERRRETSNPFA